MFDLFDERTTLFVVYGAVLLLVMLYAMALITRRVRNTQEQVDELKRELQLLNEAIQLNSDRLQQQQVKREDNVAKAMAEIDAIAARAEDDENLRNAIDEIESKSA